MIVVQILIAPVKKERIFDPRISWIAPNDVDYEGDSLCMYTLRDI